MSNQVIVFIGQIVHTSNALKLEVYEDGFLIVKNGKILAIGQIENLNSTLATYGIENAVRKTLKKTQLLVPGFIDSHIHAPQYPNAGLGYDVPLLEWLDKYTFKLEKQYKDAELSNKVYDALVRKTLDCGTTTAMYFASLFKESSLILAKKAIQYGQRAFIGKINMTRFAPDDYLETPDETIENTKEFIKEVRGLNSSLVQPVITPRFAISVDMKEMKELGKLAQEHNLNIQTHISENKDEIKFVRDLFSRSYADVYDQASLLTPKTILAHGIHLTDEELRLIAQRGTSISHCPASNTCLKSGLCDVRRLHSFNIKVGLGTDVSGGYSPSIIEAMRQALDTSIHISYIEKNYVPFTYEDVFYLATLGGAQALGLDKTVGNFETEKDFDALIVDLDVEQSSTNMLMEYDTKELLQKLIYLGDDRNIVNVFVAGNCVKGSL